MKDLLQFFLVNVGVGLFPILLQVAFGGRWPSRESALVAFVASFTYSTVIGGLAWALVPKVAVKMRGPALVRWAQLIGLLMLIGWVGGSVAFVLISEQPFLRVNARYFESMIVCILLTLGIGSITYVVGEAKGKLESTSLQLRTRELEREKAVRAATQAKLESLESRIHPHFLFNTLNSISALVRQDPELAEELIGRLAALLRYSLDRQGRMVRLEEELKITRDYLEIEKARFRERLTFALDVPAELLALEVPALSVQTLVENSVKYAVGVQRQGASIRVVARREAGVLRLEVTDSGPGFVPETCPPGHGLDTLRQRLEASFGEGAALLMRRVEPVGMEVTIQIPC